MPKSNKLNAILTSIKMKIVLYHIINELFKIIVTITNSHALILLWKFEKYLNLTITVHLD